MQFTYIYCFLDLTAISKDTKWRLHNNDTQACYRLCQFYQGMLGACVGEFPFNVKMGFIVVYHLAKQPIARHDGPLQFGSDHYRSLYTSFSLLVVLYIPEAGYDQAPIGDELMEWLNTHFIEPSTEEGDHLSALNRPWEDESFWPYLTRYVNRYRWHVSANNCQSYPPRSLQSFALFPGRSGSTSIK